MRTKSSKEAIVVQINYKYKVVKNGIYKSLLKELRKLDLKSSWIELQNVIVRFVTSSVELQEKL